METMNLKTDKCRFCENDIESVIDFGRMPIANGFIKKEIFETLDNIKNLR